MPKEKPRRGFLPKLMAAIGRHLGAIKKQEKDLYEEWVALCHANGVNPTDRILQFIAYDLESNMQQIADWRSVKKQIEVQDAFSDVQLKETIANLADEYNKKIIQLSEHYRDMILAKDQEILRLQQELINLQNQIAQLQQQFISKKK